VAHDLVGLEAFCMRHLHVKSDGTRLEQAFEAFLICMGVAGAKAWRLNALCPL